MKEQKLFTNTVLTDAKAIKIRKILLDPLQLGDWVPEIKSIRWQNSAYQIIRSNSSLNSYEEITLTYKQNVIIYESNKGKLVYRLAFTLKEMNQQTQIKEEVYLIDSVYQQLPLELINPILQKAMQTNLDNLGLLAQEPNL
ncbi:MAG: hypothetical protein J6584_05140 [Lactobacillus sp.]|uniref:SRPBCC family protein n=1 Tax=Bombilactobacillus bombi TaxID=1303590 RepID=A0A3R6VKH2_9LACO|nr:hypothetical protein [Bombilactobacillus bombi]MCO6543330.1 hypothetical protein [Lactobacillus sp.]RHW51226.1 hypothetical protein DS831_04175 [Bombilactobacillus bombi]